MSVIVIDRIIRGALGTAPFAIVDEADISVSYLTVADNTARDAIEEWKRRPYMRVYSVGADKDYRLGADVTIAGQSWTEIVNTGFQPLSEKGQPSGYAPLDATGFVPAQYIRSIFSSTSFVKNTMDDMFAETTKTGDIVAVIADPTPANDGVYIKLNNDPPTNTLADYAQILNPGSVISVNGLSGAVEITIANLLARGTNQTDFDSAVTASPSVSSTGTAITVIQGQITSLQSAISSMVTVFTDLGDVPDSYTGAARQALVVKDDESGIEFVTISSSAPGGDIGQIQYNAGVFLRGIDLASSGLGVTAYYAFPSSSSVYTQHLAVGGRIIGHVETSYFAVAGTYYLTVTVVVDSSAGVKLNDVYYYWHLTDAPVGANSDITTWPVHHVSVNNAIDQFNPGGVSYIGDAPIPYISVVATVKDSSTGRVYPVYAHTEPIVSRTDGVVGIAPWVEFTYGTLYMLQKDIRDAIPYAISPGDGIVVNGPVIGLGGTLTNDVEIDASSGSIGFISGDAVLLYIDSNQVLIGALANIQEISAPSGSPDPGYIYMWADSTDHVIKCKDSSGNIFEMKA